MKRGIAYLLVLVVLFVVSGCMSNVTVLQPVEKGARLGIVQFDECLAGNYNNCTGSGKVATQIFSEVFGAPIVEKESSSNAADFDVLLIGRVLEYNEAVPMAFRPNAAAVDVVIKRRIDGKTLITFHDSDTANNLTGSPKRILKGFAEDLKGVMGK